ncbi:MAG TPA: cobaltochelatase subunit CobN, partial [Acidimicrobiales bacterium]|nr:cobaltochelatase subunit CobN [Acidimicrobiales bacterium]
MILYLTNAPSEILALRSIIEGLPDGFPPVRAADPATLGGSVDLGGVEVVMVRLLGGTGAWPGRFADLRRQCQQAGVPLLAFGGEAAPDAEMTAASTVPSALVAQAFEYLVHGGLANVEQMLRFVSDTVCLTGFGFDPPAEVPATGVYRRTEPEEGVARVAVLFYRAHLIAGNTGFVDDLC